MREIEERYDEEFWQPYPRARQHSEFYIYKGHEEVDELHPYSDPEKPVSDEELDEVADWYFTILGYAHSRGILLSQLKDRADHKLDELIRRAEYASTQPDFRTAWDVAKWFPEKTEPVDPTDSV